KEITESAPGDLKIEITQANLSGASLERHVRFIEQSKEDPSFNPYGNKNLTLREILEKDTYDVVTIQQASKSSWQRDTFDPFANQLVAFIRERAPSSEIMIHQTWAYHPGSKRLKEWGMSREDMHRKATANYNRL